MKHVTLAEQRRIVAKVDELMALVDALETQFATARTTATALLATAHIPAIWFPEGEYQHIEERFALLQV